MRATKNEKIKYLDEGETCGVSCPDCGSGYFQFLPDIKSEVRKYGKFITKYWRCFDCNTMFVQTEKTKVNVDR